MQVVLRTYEPVRELREEVRESLPVRQVLDSIARSHKWPTYEDWLQLGRDTARIELSLERIRQQAQVSREEPWALHQLAISVRDRWLSWRRDEAYRAWCKAESQNSADSNSPPSSLEAVYSEFGIDDLQAEWNTIIDGLRWLTAHTKATM